MVEPIKKATAYTDVHRAAEEDGTPTQAMNNKRDPIWTAVNLRIGVCVLILNAVAAVAIAFASQMVFQATLAQRVTAVEETIKDRSTKRDKQFDDWDNKMVTKDALKLTVDPIVSAQVEMRGDLKDIKNILLRQYQPVTTRQPLPFTVK